MQTEMIEHIKSISESYNCVHELAAIWITDPVISTPIGRHARWVVGDKCRIENNELCDFKNHNEASHIITSCRGNIINSVLEFSVMDLQTKELQVIKII